MNLESLSQFIGMINRLLIFLVRFVIALFLVCVWAYR